MTDVAGKIGKTGKINWIFSPLNVTARKEKVLRQGQRQFNFLRWNDVPREFFLPKLQHFLSFEYI